MIVNDNVTASGNVVSGSGGVKIPGFKAAHDAWHNIAIKAAGDQVTASLDGVKLTTYTDPAPKLSGRIELGSGYYYTRFDNLKVKTVDGYPAYYGEFLDNLEMNDLAAVPATKLVYSGAWKHETGKGMYTVQRTLSTNQESGSTLSYTAEGTGFDIMGPNNGSAVLEVSVDGSVVAASAKTTASPEFYQTFSLRHLSYGKHTIGIKVLSGTLVVDAVGVAGQDWVEATGGGSGTDPTPTAAQTATTTGTASATATATATATVSGSQGTSAPGGVSGDGDLALTGPQIALFAGGGLAVIALGVLLFVIGRRRSAAEILGDDS